MFESCSGGGGRIDLGILRYVEDFWLSDNVDSLDNLFMFEGYSMAYAPKAKMMWVNDPFQWTGRSPSLTFRFHQAMTGALGLGANLLKWTAAEMQEARDHIETYKRIRHIVQHGSLYRLASLRDGTGLRFSISPQMAPKPFCWSSCRRRALAPIAGGSGCKGWRQRRAIRSPGRRMCSAARP